MEISWCVEVTLSNGKALAIGTDYVSGSADLTESDEELIREAGKSLLAFVGESPNKKLEMDACTCIGVTDMGFIARVDCPRHGLNSSTTQL